MARRGRRANRQWSNDSSERVTFDNATAIRAVLGTDNYLQALTSPPVSPLVDVEDGRRFNPDAAFRPPQTVFGRPARWSVSYGSPPNNRGVRSKGVSDIGARSGFEDARNVIVCVRRKERREVLHALRRTGSGSGRGPRRISWKSSIGCK